jgi:nitronate monooxygenase
MIHTDLCDLLGIEHPIISAPMAGSAAAELVAAVSGAGGFGLIGGTTRGGADWLRAQIRAVRERTDRPFGVGFITSAPGTAELARVALEEGVAAVAHSFADPTPYIAPAHAAGAKVLVQVQTVAQARMAAQAGADIIAAQGIEAGGHTGTTSATLPLVPAVIDAVGDIPVVAAGGIADGRGLAAVLLLGAAGVWLGTRFVASEEWAGGAWAKARVVAAGADDAVLARAYDLVNEAPFPAGIRDHVLRNDFTDTWQGRDDEVVARRAELSAQLQAAAAAGDTRIAAVRAGNAAGLIHAIEPAGAIVRRLVAEAERLLRERPAALLRGE